MQSTQGEASINCLSLFNAFAFYLVGLLIKYL